ncbi:hypothetical protein SAMN05442782_2858 [Streptomyces sp. OK228]|nr:hypothetical protein [Streptomyces sp. OK228]SOE26103.1 hypothetical protein SAMN05442782_2858 [Streptomyces sp. OK228]
MFDEAGENELLLAALMQLGAKGGSIGAAAGGAATGTHGLGEQGHGATGLVRGVVGRLPGAGADHLVEFAVAAVVFEGAQGHGGQPLRVVSTGKWGRWRER